MSGSTPGTATEEAITHDGKPYLIVVGIDYSTASELALEHALGLTAAKPNAELHVVHVIPGYHDVRTDTVVPPVDAESNLAAGAPLVGTAAELELQTYIRVGVGAFEKKRASNPSTPLRITAHLRAHAPAHQIAQLASDLEADLIVVGTHGRGSVVRFFMGSVAESVTRMAQCPVLVFRAKASPIEYPQIAPPCPRCINARFASRGKELWCEQHRDRHGQRHAYERTPPDRGAAALSESAPSTPTTSL